MFRKGFTSAPVSGSEQIQNGGGLAVVHHSLLRILCSLLVCSTYQRSSCSRDQLCKLWRLYHISCQLWYIFLPYPPSPVSISKHCQYKCVSYLLSLENTFIWWLLWVVHRILPMMLRTGPLSPVIEAVILGALPPKVSLDCPFYLRSDEVTAAFLFPWPAELKSGWLAASDWWLSEKQCCTALPSGSWSVDTVNHYCRISLSLLLVQPQSCTQGLCLEGRRRICCFIYVVYQHQATPTQNKNLALYLENLFSRAISDHSEPLHHIHVYGGS